MTKKIELIDANVSVDDRGELLFCNDFDMSKIKRFYHISNFKTPLKVMSNEPEDSPKLYIPSSKYLTSKPEYLDFVKKS